jgi:hypothetical protein
MVDFTLRNVLKLGVKLQGKQQNGGVLLNFLLLSISLISEQ